MLQLASLPHEIPRILQLFLWVIFPDMYVEQKLCCVHFGMDSFQQIHRAPLGNTEFHLSNGIFLENNIPNGYDLLGNSFNQHTVMFKEQTSLATQTPQRSPVLLWKTRYALWKACISFQEWKMYFIWCKKSLLWQMQGGAVLICHRAITHLLRPLNQLTAHHESCHVIYFSCTCKWSRVSSSVLGNFGGDAPFHLTVKNYM